MLLHDLRCPSRTVGKSESARAENAVHTPSDQTHGACACMIVRYQLTPTTRARAHRANYLRIACHKTMLNIFHSHNARVQSGIIYICCVCDARECGSRAAGVDRAHMCCALCAETTRAYFRMYISVLMVCACVRVRAYGRCGEEARARTANVANGLGRSQRKPLGAIVTFSLSRAATANGASSVSLTRTRTRSHPGMCPTSN